jgi:hypothetical protein
MKPVDLGTLLPKSTEVARSQQNEQQRPGTAQQQFATEARRHSAEQERTVRRAERAHLARIERDARRRGDAPSQDGAPRRGPRRDTSPDGKSGTGDQPGRDGRGRLLDLVMGSQLGAGEGA